MVGIKSNWWIILFISLHFFGVIGIAIPQTRDIFLVLTPINLLYTLFIILEFGIEHKLKAYLSVLLIGVLGYLVEVVGVNTGLIFGHYVYGNNLGLKVLNTPLLIGVNWIIVCVATAGVSQYLLKGNKFSFIIAAILMVFLDSFIEPICNKCDFWAWRDNIVPFKNYFDWFVVSFILSLLFKILKINLNKAICLIVYISELVFFVLLNIIL